MTVSQLDQLPGFIRLGGPDEDREIRKIYCCDEPIFEPAKRIDALL